MLFWQCSRYVTSLLLSVSAGKGVARLIRGSYPRATRLKDAAVSSGKQQTNMYLIYYLLYILTAMC